MTKPVSVIIPTTAEHRRRESLWRAIDSVREQRSVAVELILVVNGSRVDSSLLEELQGSPLRVLRLSEASLPAAIYSGRLVVRTDYFAFLDDDDIYLPDALTSRVDGLESGFADFVVSNGFRASGDLLIPNVQAVERDPFRALLVKNWLASCGGLYRTATISSEFFEGLVKYCEWTILAFWLLMAGKKVHFLDRATFRLSDTEGSASKHRSKESMSNGIAAIEYMFAHVPRALRSDLSRKRAAAYHDMSEYYLHCGDITQAWRMHALSMRSGGWQYLTYTRHMIRRTCAPWLGR